MITHRTRDERGGALLLALLISIAVSGLAITSVVMSGNAQLINAFEVRQNDLEATAEAGIEIGRARVNASAALFPTTGYTTLENRVAVRDAEGRVIPGLWRSVYVGPVGNRTGQFGNFGNIVSIAGDRGRDRVIRRTDITEESFAKYAYFTNVEPANIAFGSGDYLTGPVHSNDNLEIYASGATFQGPVSTHGEIVNARAASFLAGVTEGASFIPMPTTRQLNELRERAQEGGASFSGSNGGTEGQARVRIEFVAVNIDGEPGTTGEDEGFFKVYVLNNDNGTNREWLVADLPNLDPDDFTTAANRNCGYRNAAGAFVRVDTMTAGTASQSRDRRRDALRRGTRACHLGGANALNANGQFAANDGRGTWQPYGGAVDPRVVAAVGAAEAAVLHPLSHDLNPDFKGVIYVHHKVVVSGTVRGRVTLAARNNIIIGDDLVYATDPGAGTCADMLGLFSGTDILVADNMINTPQDPDWNVRTTYEELPGDERLNAVLLALDQFYVENFDQGPGSGQACDGTQRGRGCLRLAGGIIQETRGAVGQTNGNGYVKRYGYDACAAQHPPPYFPTTGKFRRVGVYEVDPTGFELGQIFR